MNKSSRIIALLGISLLSFTGFLDSTIVSSALPSLQKNLNMNVTELQWVMNAFFVGISAFMTSMGRIADIYGRRKFFYIGIGIFGLASIGAGLSTQPIYLIFFRAIQGITTAMVGPVAASLIQFLFEKDKAKAMGLYTGITGLGLALGPLMGGLLVSYLGWRSIFLVNIPFILLGFVLCSFTLPESRSEEKMSLDIYGTIFLALMISSLVFGLVEADVYGWKSPLIISSFVVFIFSSILLTISEFYAKDPIISGILFHNPVFNSLILFVFVGGGLMAVELFINPLYLNLILQKNFLITGLFLFIIPATLVVSSPIIGYINHQIGPRKIIIFGGICFFLAILTQLLFSLKFNVFLLVPSFIIFGFAWAISNQAPSVALAQSTDQNHITVALGALFSFFNIGAAIMLGIGTSLFHWRATTEILESYAMEGVLLNEKQNALLAKFIEKPDTMHSIIPKLQIGNADAASIFKTAFMSGMHSMFWPLLFLSVIALIIVIFTLKIPSQQASPQEERE